MQPIVVKGRRFPAVVALGVSVLVVAIGARTILAPRGVLPRSDLVLGVVLVVGFGILAALSLRAALDGRPRLVVDDEGIEDRTLGVGRIPWSAIGGARPAAQRNLPLLCLEVRDEDAWLAKLSRARRALARRQRAIGLAPFVVNLLGTGISAATLAELVNVRAGAVAGPVGGACRLSSTSPEPAARR